MLNYIVRRVLYGVLVLIGVNLVTFFLFFTVEFGVVGLLEEHVPRAAHP